MKSHELFINIGNIILRLEEVTPLALYHPESFSTHLLFQDRRKFPPYTPYHPFNFNIRQNSAIGTLPLLLFQYGRKFRYWCLTTPDMLIQKKIPRYVLHNSKIMKLMEANHMQILITKIVCSILNMKFHVNLCLKSLRKQRSPS